MSPQAPHPRLINKITTLGPGVGNRGHLIINHPKKSHERSRFSGNPWKTSECIDWRVTGKKACFLRHPVI